MSEKIAPYMLPIFEILNDHLRPEMLKKLLEEQIKTIPLAFMRGATFQSSFILADEAQNMTPSQMRMLLTRIGKHSKMVITGDVKQTDIHSENGLSDAIRRFIGMDHVAIVKMTENSIVRSPLIAEIERRYEIP